MVEYQSFDKKTDFLVEVVDENHESGLDTYCYPGALVDAWVPGVAIIVTTSEGIKWHGHFMSGNDSPNGDDLCCIHPNGKSLVIVSKGSGYVVSIENPKNWIELPMRPIMGHCFDDETSTLILYGFTRLYGIQGDGIVWKTKSVSWDGLKSVILKDGKVHGEGWDAPSEKFVPFDVDIISGDSNGGARPP